MLERQVAQPAPAAPRFKPHGRMKIGSSTMFSRQPHMVPMLACSEEPSARTRYASTTFKMDGAEPSSTVQNK